LKKWLFNITLSADMAKYTLNNLESLTGIKADTIRIWEMRYGILEAHRTSTNRRWYTDNDLVKLLNINILSGQGLKISKIARMSDSEIMERAAFLAEGNSDTADEISQILIAMNRLDEKSISDILLRSMANKGFEETFISVVFPFLNKVGFLWHTGSVDPGTEHFITALLRKRLISAIDGVQAQRPVAKVKKIMLFLPENEWHELVLLFFAWLILKKGHQILYLGQSTPLESVFEMAKIWKPDAVLTGTMTMMPFDEPSGYLAKLAGGLKGIVIFAGGTLAKHAGKKDLKGISFLNGPGDDNLRFFLEARDHAF
jgi:MerR family transcriptional regulator, light-induced transcriptional regulator